MACADKVTLWREKVNLSCKPVHILGRHTQAHGCCALHRDYGDHSQRSLTAGRTGTRKSFACGLKLCCTWRKAFSQFLSAQLNFFYPWLSQTPRSSLHLAQPTPSCFVCMGCLFGSRKHAGYVMQHALSLLDFNAYIIFSYRINSYSFRFTRSMLKFKCFILTSEREYIKLLFSTGLKLACLFSFLVCGKESLCSNDWL